jgi:hypothetical protein
VWKSKDGLSKGQDQLLKGKLMMEHGLGLGHQPNVIPAGHIDITGEERKVEIGWHPVAGFAGQWFAEKTSLGKFIKDKIHKYPDPTQHWAVLIGDYVHELWMVNNAPVPPNKGCLTNDSKDEHLDIIYINEVLKREEWTTFEVGTTRFSDEAIKQASKYCQYDNQRLYLIATA